MGGKPSPGTKSDKRLAENKNPKPSSPMGVRPAKTPKPKKGVNPFAEKKA
jgi:hypothetical protein